VASGEHPAGGGDHDRPRRLPHRQHDLPSRPSRACSRCWTGSCRRWATARRLLLPLHELARAAGDVPRLAGHDIAAIGIPTEEEYVARYCQRTGRDPIDPDHWDFYIAYNMFEVPRSSRAS
jgi:hypothetical protein